MSDNKTRITLEHRACLTREQEAKRAGIPADRRTRVPRRMAEAGTITRVKVDDFWYETLVDDEWVAAYRIISQPEGLVVGEMRIFPADDIWRNRQTRRGEWSGTLQGTRATAPRGGVTARLLRQVRIDQTIWDGKEVLGELTKVYKRIADPEHPRAGHLFVPQALARAGVGRTLNPPPRPERVGRKRLPDAEYQRIVQAYTELRLKGLRGRELYPRLAKKLKLTEPQARNRVSRARRYGFLQHLPARRRRG